MKQLDDEMRCQSYTQRGTRCRRRGTCWSVGKGRHCVTHMRELEPRNVFWLF